MALPISEAVTEQFTLKNIPMSADHPPDLPLEISSATARVVMPLQNEL
ncbi:hypothetical protein [Aureliella helgolandensis]|nr:hypothetical protein [Aureliella helgolandensis]